jgi:hypothetical protein
MSLLMALLSAATCYAGTVEMGGMTPHACCAEMAGACPGQMVDVQDCCVTPLADLAANSSHVAIAPSTDSILLLSPPYLASTSSTPVAQDAANSSSPPTYLLVSVFRI